MRNKNKKYFMRSFGGVLPLPLLRRAAFCALLALAAQPLAAQKANSSIDSNVDISEKADYFRSKKSSTANNSANDKIFDDSVLRNMVVYGEGRVMPFDSYARNLLLILNGKSTIKIASGKKIDATQWLARVMFTPAETLDDEVFKITFPDALHAIGLSQEKSRRYSFNTLAIRLPQIQQLASFSEKIPAEKRNAIEKEFLRIYDSYVRYYNALSAFLFALPTETFRFSSEEVVAELGLNAKQFAENGGTYSYLQLMEVSNSLFAWAETAAAKAERERTAEDLMVLEMRARYLDFPVAYSSLPLKVFPSFAHSEEKWFSPWQLFVIAKGKNIIDGEVLYLKSMVESYRNKNFAGFNENVNEFKNSIAARLVEATRPIVKKVNAEAFYNRLDPFYNAMLAFFFILPLIVPFFWGTAVNRFIHRYAPAKLKNISFSKFFYYASVLLLLLGFLLTIVGIGLRMYITSRPPITNLYTTFVFVAATSVFLCLLLERFFRGAFGLLSGAISGALLLLISMYFSAQGDTMEVLIAVLRSNFWLSTHVITINLGYAGIVLSGVIAHVLLIYYLRKKQNSVTEKKLIQMVYATQAFGLIFTVIGTLLGGIWADQSWGRFWGWDPKENGSLLIVLWSAIAFHARFSGLVKNVGFAALAVVGIMVVMLAWFGINLLGVGLHSYGFTSGIAYPLFLYMSLQVVFLFLLLYFLEIKKSMKGNTKKKRAKA